MKIEILPNPNKDNDFIYTQKLTDILSEYDAEIFLPPMCENSIQGNVSFCDCKSPDIVIAIGGDGSIMRAAHKAADCGALILGINLGRLGFLAEIDTNELELVRKIFTNEYSVDKRMMLDVYRTFADGKKGKKTVALNDAVVSHGRVSKIVETELLCNGEFLGKFRSDGFLISTPTGSTAYSLSAGGPVMDPAVRGICLVPICPHSLTARSMIVPDSSVIELRCTESGGISAFLTIDGQEAGELRSKESVVITASDKTADFIKINRDRKRNFYEILQDKMTGI